jgi:hypothetical protein
MVEKGVLRWTVIMSVVNTSLSSAAKSGFINFSFNGYHLK